MPGKKKPTLGQSEKRQAQTQVRTKSESSRSTGSTTAIKGPGIFAPNPKSKEVMDELKKMRAITPYTVASRLDLRLSVAKHFLKDLERQGTVEYVSGSKNLKIYKIPGQ